jgi:hypothetical protein
MVVNKQMLGHFNCFAISGGSLRVASDYRVLCYSREWWQLTPFAVVGVCVYMGGVLGLFPFLIWRGRNTMQLRSDRWRARIGVIFEQYKSEYETWELGLLVKRTAGILLGAFLQPSFQPVTLFLFAIMASAGMEHRRR